MMAVNPLYGSIHYDNDSTQEKLAGTKLSSYNVRLQVPVQGRGV